MKVAVMGGAGYLGGVLCQRLLSDGHEVIVLDSLKFGRRGVEGLLKEPKFHLVVGDIRDISTVSKVLKDCRAVVVLASLVGEAACDLNPAETVDINFLATLNIARCAAYYGLKRFIFTSTDSCYGAQENVFLTEESPLQPISLYAELKAKVEAELLGPAFQELRPVVLRLATLYGLAPRMRFDLVINLLTREAVCGPGAKIFSGEQWRPLVHVCDAAKAFALALEAPDDLVGGRVFNVGSNDQNVQFKDLAGIIKKALPNAVVETIPQPPDLRDYHVNFDRITQDLGYQVEFQLIDGILEIKEALESGFIASPYDGMYRNA